VGDFSSKIADAPENAIRLKQWERWIGDVLLTENVRPDNGVVHERPDDAGGTGRILITWQENDDVVLSVIPDGRERPPIAVVTFSSESEGGRSPDVHHALKLLTACIALDNQMLPLPDADA
jgi:hypothetical protein